MRKPANSNGQGGEFQTQFAFKMPDGVQQGIYNFKTAVYLNNVKMQEGSAQLQVV
jgi:LEA14-like dessication related protein